MRENKFGLKQRDMDILNGIFSKTKGLEKAYMFGSRAMGNYSKGSDIDIALFGKSLNLRIITRIRSLLNQELPIPFHVDIIDYKKISNNNLKKHIDEHGIKVYDRSIDIKKNDF